MLILHGDNQTASRQAFLDKKKAARDAGLNLLELSGEKLQLSELVNSLDTQSLFGHQNLVVIQDFFSSHKVGKEKTLIIEYLHEHQPTDLLFWESKNVAIQLKTFPVSAVLKFDLPKYLFSYLESFSLTDLKHTLENTEPQIVFFMLVRHLQSLIMVSSGTSTSYPAWKTAKLKKQAVGFTSNRLIALHSRLLDIDFRQKNSLSPLDLSQSLEIWSLSAIK